MTAQALQPLSWTTRGPYPEVQELFQGWVLDVVLGGVLVDELVAPVDPLAVRVVDLDEWLPLVGERILREDRLDRTLRFACPAVRSVDAAGEGERVLSRDDGADRLGLIRLLGLDAHHPPRGFA